MIDRDPIEAPEPTLTKGPIETSTPIVASGAMELAGSMPLLGGVGSIRRLMASANATYGFLARTIAVLGRGRKPRRPQSLPMLQSSSAAAGTWDSQET